MPNAHELVDGRVSTGMVTSDVSNCHRDHSLLLLDPVVSDGVAERCPVTRTALVTLTRR